MSAHITSGVFQNPLDPLVLENAEGPKVARNILHILSYMALPGEKVADELTLG